MTTGASSGCSGRSPTKEEEQEKQLIDYWFDKIVDRS
jgi:hypothetical protein